MPFIGEYMGKDLRDMTRREGGVNRALPKKQAVL